MKKRIKVVYDGPLDVAVDELIRKAMKGIGAKWYAQGCDYVEPYERDICFDLEIATHE